MRPRIDLDAAVRIVPEQDCAICAMGDDVCSGECRATRAIVVAFVIGYSRRGVDTCSAHRAMIADADEDVWQLKGGQS